jgi:hypothetical protein
MLRKCVIFRTMLPIRCAHIIGPPYVFAMDVPLEFTQDESGSASFGIRAHRAEAYNCQRESQPRRESCYWPKSASRPLQPIRKDLVIRFRRQ